MPRYSSSVVGPSLLSSTNRMLRSLHRVMRVLRCLEHLEVFGAPAMKKSFK